MDTALAQPQAPAGLAATQAAFARALTQPFDFRADRSGDYTLRLDAYDIDLLRDIRPRPPASSAERLGIYNQQYWEHTATGTTSRSSTSRPRRTRCRRSNGTARSISCGHELPGCLAWLPGVPGTWLGPSRRGRVTSHRGRVLNAFRRRGYVDIRKGSDELHPEIMCLAPGAGNDCYTQGPETQPGFTIDPAAGLSILRAVRPLTQALIILCIATFSGCGIDEFLDEPSSDPTPDDIANAALAPKPARTYEAIGQDVICPGSFGTFKRKIADSSKDPGSGYQWHHIVNQNPTNVDRFGNRLHCTDNLLSLPTSVHRKVSGHYGEKPNWTNGKRVRDVINQRSWTKQYEYGLEVLQRHGVAP